MMIGDAKGSVDPDVPCETVLQTHLYPCISSAVSLALNDLGRQQHVLSNPHNFVEDSACEVFEIMNDGTGLWIDLRRDDDVKNYVKNCLERQKPVSTRIIFLPLATAEGGSFGCRLPLSHSSTHFVLQHLAVRPEHVPFMLGQFGGNHLPPGHFECYDATGKLEALDFICQQPRWGFRVRHWPISTWIGFRQSSTNCIVTYGSDDKRIASVRTRLTSSFLATGKLQVALANASDPFLVPSMISHECFMQSDSSIFNLGQRLYAAIDRVDEAHRPRYNRNDLESVTFELHQVSQDADSLIQSTDIAISIAESISVAQRILQTESKALSRQQIKLSQNSGRHLVKAFKARKRWLLAAKSRKDTTMNFVYNIVSQKEAETSLAIARDTKNDSSSMKAIACLTMVFLPATAVTSFFGMSFFNAQGGKFTIASEWWISLAVTIPLTIVVVVFWWLWEVFAIKKPAKRSRRALYSRLQAFQNVGTLSGKGTTNSESTEAV